MITKQDVINAYNNVCKEFDGKDFNQIVIDYYADINTMEEASEIDSLPEVDRGYFRFEINRCDDGTAQVLDEFTCYEFIEDYAEPDDKDDICLGFNVWIRDNEIGTDGTYPKHSLVSQLKQLATEHGSFTIPDNCPGDGWDGTLCKEGAYCYGNNHFEGEYIEYEDMDNELIETILDEAVFED